MKDHNKRKKKKIHKKKMIDMIDFMGREYSSMLNNFDYDEKKLSALNLPILRNSHDLAKFLSISVKRLKFLGYHKKKSSVDHYYRYKIPKKNGGYRNIAAPKKKLKKTQKTILDKILYAIPVSKCAHGYVKGKSVLTNANFHINSPPLLINMDLKDFFPSITFKRVRGLFISCGYSGHISTLLSLLCTYCKRKKIKEDGTSRFTAITRRILPQGSPASPMISNIICKRLDKRLNGLAKSLGLRYSRYADDISFSTEDDINFNVAKFCSLARRIVTEEGFKLNEKKTKILREYNRQEMLGIVKNNPQIGLSKKRIRKLRAEIHNSKNLKKEGILTEKTKQRLVGMAEWIKSVNEERYKSLIEEIYELIN